jgi:hypothetical protein
LLHKQTGSLPSQTSGPLPRSRISGTSSSSSRAPPLHQQPLGGQPHGARGAAMQALTTPAARISRGHRALGLLALGGLQCSSGAHSSGVCSSSCGRGASASVSTGDTARASRACRPWLLALLAAGSVKGATRGAGAGAVDAVRVRVPRAAGPRCVPGRRGQSVWCGEVPHMHADEGHDHAMHGQQGSSMLLPLPVPPCATAHVAAVAWALRNCPCHHASNPPSDAVISDEQAASSWQQGCRPLTPAGSADAIAVPVAGPRLAPPAVIPGWHRSHPLQVLDRQRQRPVGLQQQRALCAALVQQLHGLGHLGHHLEGGGSVRCGGE